MKEKLKEMLPYLIAIIILFYLLPFLIKDSGSAMSVMLIWIPAGCFITSLIYGIKHSFNIFFVLFVILLFAPTIEIFYNQSASIYCSIYGAIALIGTGLGAGIYYLKNKYKKD